MRFCLSLPLSLSFSLSHCVHASCCRSRSICCISQRLLRVIPVSLITHPISLMRLIIPALSSFRYMHGVKYDTQSYHEGGIASYSGGPAADPKMTHPRSRRSFATVPRFQSIDARQYRGAHNPPTTPTFRRDKEDRARARGRRYYSLYRGPRLSFFLLSVFFSARA